MNIYCINHNYLYETEKLLFLFMPFEKNTCLKDFAEDNGDYFYTEITKTEDKIYFKAELSLKGEKQSSEREKTIADCTDEEYDLLSLAYPLLKNMCGYAPKWGMLTGVRPSKLLLNKMEEKGEEYAVDYFLNRFFVDEKKTALALSVAKAEREIIKNSPENSFSLYISIPFCPTRCSYCSFVSHSIGTDSAKRLVPDYVDKLCEEIAFTGRKAMENGLVLTTVYWGGGTPTTLTHEQLDRVLSVIEESFDLSSCREYTVEAGRPDTITKEKLQTLKNHGVNRISINPQTFNDGVLREIGRQHTSELTIEKYLLAREMGFSVINMDLIAGLPTDTMESFEQSVNKAISLGADNITVHTLALKRSSTLVTEDETDSVTSKNIEAMLDYSVEALTNAGYHPYYMYRQSKALGNFENVGWCKNGKECEYNILMMEEYQHILSVGAGSVTKLLSPNIEKIERIFNYKFPFEYISRFEELLSKKERITEFFKEYNK
ncbi:MAG: coproporphyrinogen dehydrogenase HemZ [Clostridia bacterium]|nr:coproporphyrinogen dehydrogenase HemZ [Clostridia bacterium]